MSFLDDMNIKLKDPTVGNTSNLGRGPEETVDPELTEETTTQSKQEAEASKREEYPGLHEAFDQFGDDFEPFFPQDHETARALMSERIRSNTTPDSVNPWQVRIGLSTFVVPPVNLRMSTTSKIGSLGGGLRSASSPKFNTGHSETMLTLGIYFPTHQSIWGTDGDVSLSGVESDTIINFDEDDDHIIDRYMSSLRGLITQFKYAPFLPIKNARINGAMGINAVALESMNISTVDGFPFCLYVELNLLRFNHKMYLPMVSDFDNAIHWGKYRQYMGRAAMRMHTMANQSWLANMDLGEEEIDPEMGEGEFLDLIREENRKYNVANSGIGSFNSRREWSNASSLELYYPSHTPSRVAFPDLSFFREETNSLSKRPKEANWWQDVLTSLGFNYATTKEARYESASKYWGSPYGMTVLSDEDALLDAFMKRVGKNASSFTQQNMDEYINLRVEDFKKDNPNASDQAVQEFATQIRHMWFANLYKTIISDPHIDSSLSYQEWSKYETIIKEWEVPMKRLGLENRAGEPIDMLVESVSVGLANNLVKMQLQMEETPAYQHIGSHDTHATISMLVFGGDSLTLLTRAISHVNGLARLESGHGVLGFLGIKNAITALAGMKYCMIQGLETESIPEYPDVYRVRLTLLDFDVFQQKREMLSSSQQKTLMDAFSKRNPFLRLKQFWGAFNLYPDMPLEIRDQDGYVVGNLDPDFYFRSFETIDEDVVDFEEVDPVMNYTMMVDGSEEGGVPSGMEVSSGGVRFTGGDDDVNSTAFQFWEPNAEEMPSGYGYVPDLTPAKAFLNTYTDGTPNPRGQFESVIKDTRYRDMAGHMVRAFPTYMLWLIDEGGQHKGVKLYDNFYGLQSVLDVALLSSEDSMDDTLVIQLSNIYSRLSTEYRDLLDESLYSTAKIINNQINQSRNLASGLTEYLVQLDTVDLKPGVRIHLRLGYSANPNMLETVFNGTITEVEQGEVVTITCQSDTVELSGIINSSDKNAHTGKIDGSLFGSFYFSEPRDLMTRLLSMGGSVARDTVAHATRGKVFSENRFGIRHFGMILTDPMSSLEEKLTDSKGAFLARVASMSSGGSGDNDAASIPGFTGNAPSALDSNGSPVATDVVDGPMDALAAATISPVGAAAGVMSLDAGAKSMAFGTFDMFTSALVNLSKERDFELYRRNIYPGNGTGLGQFTGGDLGDGGVAMAMGPGGITAEEASSLGVSSDTVYRPAITAEKLFEKFGPGDGTYLNNTTVNGSSTGLTVYDDPNHGSDLGSVVSGAGRVVKGTVHPFSNMMGLTREMEDDDVSGADEVSFRASTYMKSVWDIFMVCAALLPNYIVAVRPFENRSTVFYGKPHWNWTSEVWPVSTGLKSVEYSEPDDTMSRLLRETQAELDKERESDEEFYDRVQREGAQGAMASAMSGSQLAYALDWSGDPLSLPQQSEGIGGGVAYIPKQRGTISMEMHLPVAADLQEDIKNHLQLDILPKEHTHPFYMDRAVNNGVGYGGKDPRHGGRGGHAPFRKKYTPDLPVMHGDHNDWPGTFGSTAGPLPPDIEQWYMAMQWPYVTRAKMGVFKKLDCEGHSYWKGGRHKRVLAYNVRTKKACVLAPAEWGPHGEMTRRIAGISPDAFHATDSVIDDEFIFGFMPDDTPLGLVNMDPNTRRAGVTVGTTNDDFGVGVGANSHGNMSVVSNETTIPEWMRAENFFDLRKRPDGTRETDHAKFALEWGWRERLIPVNYDSEEWPDAMGRAAKEVYQNHRSDSEAENIWDEFREFFVNENENLDKFKQAFPSPNAEAAFGPSLGQGSGASKYRRAKEMIDEEFYKFMWRNAYNRGWVVLVTNTKKSAGGLLTGDVAGGADWAGADVVAGTVGGVGDAIDSLGAFVTGGDKRDWDFHPIRPVYELFLQDPERATEYMKNNRTPGEKMRGILGTSVEKFQRNIIQPVIDILKSIAKAITAAVSGVMNLIRLFRLLMNGGLSMAAYNQKQANSLNKIFNDSIYYSAGPPGSLAYYVDNPFTREFHEPVVEIREPFQKVHFIDSFSKIIDNKVTEFTNAPTVVTATSNGGNPVTVHFDKGAPPERQIETSVETGLAWVKPDGPPILKYILNPIDTMASFSTRFNNGDQETSAKRIALWYLKEGLKDIYGGEITIIGDPSIRPHDLIYLADVKERMYGLCQVEQVVHHFNAEMGFVTSITPNAIVTINDPAQWTMTQYIRNRLFIQSVRKSAQNSFVRYRDEGAAIPSQMTLMELARSFEPEIMGSISYTGGNTALIKDFAGADATGVLVDGEALEYAYQSTESWWGSVVGGVGDYYSEVIPPGASAGTNTAGAIAGGFAAGPVGAGAGVLGVNAAKWWAWNKVKSKLMDQQSCVIQYLTKNGRPMDGGLSSNSGVAVGQQRVSTIFKNSLRIKLPFNDENGNSVITTDDILSDLGYREKDIDFYRYAKDMYTNEILAKIGALAGRPDPAILTDDEYEVYWVSFTDGGTVGGSLPSNTGIVDGDTIYISPPISGGESLRLAGINAPEIPSSVKNNPYLANITHGDTPGVASFLWLRNYLLRTTGEYGLTFAVRVMREKSTDKYNRAYGWIFSDVGTTGMDEEQRKNKLMADAGSSLISWDSFRVNGTPYTANWASVVAGHSNVYLYGLDSDLPEDGASGGIVEYRGGDDD